MDLITAEQARNLAHQATRGPWTQGWEDEHGWVAFVSDQGERVSDEQLVITALGGGTVDERADAALIAAAPDLAATVEALWERIERALAERSHDPGCASFHSMACDCWISFLRADR